MGCIMILQGGGGGTSTLHYVIEVVSTFCDLVWWVHKNLVYTGLTPLTPAGVQGAQGHTSGAGVGGCKAARGVNAQGYKG